MTFLEFLEEVKRNPMDLVKCILLILFLIVMLGLCVLKTLNEIGIRFIIPINL